MEEFKKLPLEIGDKVVIKDGDGSYDCFTSYFDYAKEELIAQMGESMYLLAKRNFNLLYDKFTRSEITLDIEYTVIGFAPRYFGGVVQKGEEILVLMDEDGNVVLFANEEKYFKPKAYHVYPSMLKSMFGEHLILHINDKEIEIGE